MVYKQTWQFMFICQNEELPLNKSDFYIIYHKEMRKEKSEGKNTSPKEELKQSLDGFIDCLRGFIDGMKDLEKLLEDGIKELETETEKKKMEEKSQSDERVNGAINTLREVPEN